MSNPVIKSDLLNAIKAAYELKKMKKINRVSYLFILTDGLSCYCNNQYIKYFCLLCEKIGIKIVSIGLGIFPYKTQKFFDSFIYSLNPDNLLKAISIIFGKKIKVEKELVLTSKFHKEENLSEIFNKIKNNNKFYFKELIEKLQKIDKGDDDLSNLDNILLKIEIKKYIYRIKNENGKESFGFFCKIPFQNKDNLKPFLIIDNNAISKEIIENEKIIVLAEEQNKTIEINFNGCIKYQNKLYGINLIEVKKDIERKINILEFDMELIENIFNQKQNINYSNEKVYTFNYIEGELFIFNQKIKNLFEDDKYGYLHSKNNILSENNIFPIISLNNHKMIGINKNDNKTINLSHLFTNMIEVKYYIEHALKEFNLKQNQSQKEIGKGGFGKVYLIEYKEKKYALKKIPLILLEEKDINSLKEVLNALLTSNNKYIVKYYDYFIDKEYFNVIMEYVGKLNLQNIIDEHKAKNQLIEENEILNITKQIYQGLKEIRKFDIVHRDLKPENILINENNEIKIGDFGTSKCLRNSKNHLKSIKGTIFYMAPEVFDENYNNKVDLYSFGCIIYELFTLKVYYKIKMSDKKIEKINLDIYNEKWQKLIDLLLKNNYEERTNLEEISEYFE